MKDIGFSPTFGTLALVLILLFSIGISFFVFTDVTSVNQSVQAGVDVKNDINGVTVTWEHRGNADKIKIMKNSEEIARLEKISDTTTVKKEQGETIEIIAVNDNNETNLKTVVASSELEKSE